MQSVGPTAARRIIRIIDSKLSREQEKFGAPLSGNLSMFRKLRIGDYRVVYQVVAKQVIVHVLAVGPHRDKEVYQEAATRKK